MILILFRHGIAVEADEFDGTDFERPLTADGKRRAKEAAQGLISQVPDINAVLSSPKVRARQTAEILCDVLGKKAPGLVLWDELAGDEIGEVVARLQKLDADAVVVCTGHEPYLSRLAALLLTGDADGMEIELKKAGAVGMEIVFKPLSASLLWHLTARQLRGLASEK